MTRRMGMPPATLASKPIGRFLATARAKSSSPCSARSFDDYVDVGGVEEFAPAGGDACAFGGFGFGNGLAAADGGDDKLHSAAALDEGGVFGDDVGRGAADGSESDNSYTDVFHGQLSVGRGQ